MPTPPSRSSHRNLDRLPSVKQIVGDSWNQYNENRDLDYSLVLPPIRYVSPSPSTRPDRESDRRLNDSYQRGFWPTKLPPLLGPQITPNVFESDSEQDEEEHGEKDNGGDDDEPRRRAPTPPTPPLQSVPQPQPQPQHSSSQSQSQQSSLTVPELRPILRLSPRALEEGGPELEAQQHSLLHQYRLPPSLSAENAAPAPPAYVYQTPTAPQPSSGPVPYSFNVLRTQQGDLVNVRTPSVRAQGILRPTAILEDEDESHKRYKCDWPGCDKKYDRPSSLEVHKHSHTRTQPFPCPESGCARAFSVKSNMLRHFRSHPRRSGLSAAEVSAASARKAAGIAAAAEAYESANNKKEEDKRKNKGRNKEKTRDRNEGGDGEVQGEVEREEGGGGEREGDKEGNKDRERDKEKEKDKDKPRTSILPSNPKPPPILTITPAPPTSTITSSSGYPATRARTALATAIAAAASTSDLNGSEMSSAVAMAAPISPSVSPSPSPLLSPLSPQSTCSSVPTSVSGRSTSLLSPSFTSSVSAPTSSATSFSPQSTELLTPYSMYSPNSQYSAQSPRSPTFSSTSASASASSDKEGERDRGKPHSPTRVDLDREHERRKSISPTPIPILVTAPSYTASPTISVRSPSPPQRHSFFSTSLRSPSPVSPQYRTRALYPVSETRTSIDDNGAADASKRISSSSSSSSSALFLSSRQDTQEPSLAPRRTLPLPRRTRSPTQVDKDPRMSIASHVPSLGVPSSMSLSSGNTDKGKGRADDSAIGETQDRRFQPSSLPEPNSVLHSSSVSGRLMATAESNSSPGTAPLSSNGACSSTPVLENPSSQSDSRSRAMSRLRQRECTEKDRGYWPEGNPVQKKAYHGHIIQRHSLIGDEEEEDDEEEEEEEEEEREDVMEDVEIAGDKKKGRSSPTTFGILKPGFGKKIIERQQRQKSKSKDDVSDFNLNKLLAGKPQQEKQQSYMDVDSSECASLSDPPDASMSRFTIRAGLGSRLRDIK